MNFRKILAVAMVAVFGVVGMVSAQGTPISDNKIPDPVTGTMSVSYEVNLIAEMTIVDRDLKDAAISTDTASRAVQVGTAGTIKVITNYPAWDILLDLTNEGNLVSVDPNTWVETKLQKLDSNGDPDGDVELDIVIAARPLAGASGPNIGATRIASGDKDDTISFAEVIGTTLGATPIHTGGRSGNAIKDNGFAATNATSGVDFIVNVGLALDGGSVGGNSNGIYSETLTFTLVAEY